MTDLTPTGLINRISNGSFQQNPEGTASGVSGTACFVNFTRLSQSAAIQTSQLSVPEPGQVRAIRLTQTNATAQRMGLCQTIVSQDCADLRSSPITVQFRYRFSLTTPVIFALLEYDGTADTSPADPINDWTSTLYVPGQFFKSNFTVLDIGIAAQIPANVWAPAPNIPFQANSGLNNLILVAWTQNTVAQNATLDLGLMMVSQGVQQLPYPHEPYALQSGDGGGSNGIEVLTNIASLQAQTWTSLTAPTLTSLVSNYVTGDGGGTFRYDSTDTTSPDNGGTIVVTASGLRYKREASAGLFVTWFGNCTTGSGFTSALTAALAAAPANGAVFIPSGSYTLTSKITVPVQVGIYGIGVRPLITKGFNGDMFDMSAAESIMENIQLRGVGGTYSGRGIVFGTASSGYQHLTGVWIYDTAGPSLEFTANDAGGGFNANLCTFQRLNNALPAVVLPSSDTFGGRCFEQCSTVGSVFVQFNGSFNTWIIGCQFGNLDFSNSDNVAIRAVITGNRIATAAADFAIYGDDSAITANVIAGAVTVNGVASRNVIGQNTVLGGATTTDNSTSTGDNVNEIWDGYYSPTVLFKADTVDPNIGSTGTKTCRVTRRGRMLYISIELTFGGAGIAGGTGGWYFQLPAPFTTWVARNTVVGSARLNKSGSQFYQANSYVLAGFNVIHMYNTQTVSAGSPLTPSAGDQISLSIEYEIS